MQNETGTMVWCSILFQSISEDSLVIRRRGNPKNTAHTRMWITGSIKRMSLLILSIKR